MTRKAKARLQAGGRYTGTFDVLFRTVRTEGFSTLYRGFGAILVGGTPGTVLYLCSYEWFRDKILAAGDGKEIDTHGSNSTSISNISGMMNGGRIPEYVAHFASGMLAETVACVIYVPVDVIKERLQVQGMYRSSNVAAHSYYRGSFDAMRQIARQEGVGGIYKGYGATLASFGPYSALYFVLYEKAKEWARISLESSDYSVSGNRHKLDHCSEIPFSYIMCCSALSCAAASWVTSPLDMAKLRLQLQRANGVRTDLRKDKYSSGDPKKLQSIVGVLRDVFRTNGVRGLFAGAGARVIHCVPLMTITMTCYEECRQFYARSLALS